MVDSRQEHIKLGTILPNKFTNLADKPSGFELTRG